MKILQGTFRKDRANASAPVAVGTGPRAPAFLPKRAVEWFGVLKARLEPLSLSSETYTERLAILADDLAEIDELCLYLQENGRTYATTTPAGDTMYRPRPEAAMLQDAKKRASSGLAEFGLTPASIGKVSAQKNEKGASAFEGFGG